ncbi:MAG: hypothetical protein H0V13_06405 [Nocardioidaceae bacterium]|nr:hypothetical protein [Nocardioidaceae bacterium]
MTRSRFVGAIAGIGTASGTRVVAGRWTSSPLGAFSDVMVQQADGHRLLLAPSDEVAEFIRLTYTFDEIVRTPVLVEPAGDHWRIDTDPLQLELTIGARPVLGHVLRVVPRRVAVAPWWARVTDPVARMLLPGIHTRGCAGHGRREWYAATDLHRITGASGTWREEPMGELRPVEPPVRFGFSSAPRSPSLTHVVTTVEH